MRFQKNFRVRLRDLKIFNRINKGIRKRGVFLIPLFLLFLLCIIIRGNLEERQWL